MSLACRRLVLAGTFALACLAASPAAADPMRVVLKDGGVVTGELIAVQSGRVVIRSSSLGLVQLEQTRIASMTPMAALPKPSAPEARPAESAPPSGQGATPQAVMGSMLQSLMATDPEVLAQLGKLQESELMKEILADPELMAKIRAGDYAALGQDPRIQKLLSDPSVRTLQKRATQ